MKISMHAMSVGVFVPMLGNLSSLLDKGTASATTRKFETEVLASGRLAPDMLPLTRQVQLACDFAKNSTARLEGLRASLSTLAIIALVALLFGRGLPGRQPGAAESATPPPAAQPEPSPPPLVAPVPPSDRTAPGSG